MKQAIHIILSIALLSTLTNCNGQSQSDKKQTAAKTDKSKVVGGGCDGCDIMFVGMPDVISAEHTSIGWTEESQKLILTGKVLELDGRTTAPNVIVYYWHTDDDGLYAPNDQTPGSAAKHGRLRGWVSSDENGNYMIKTSHPAAYPDQDIPQHIHLSIKEPDIADEYYTTLYFDDDPLYLAYKKKHGTDDRAGTEVLRLLLDSKVEVAEHNIVLGLNIPNYPKRSDTADRSGLNIGEDQPSFVPYHAFGPDKGTRTCPVCKYGRYHGIVYFVGNDPNWDNIKEWLSFLELQSTIRSKYLKVYFVYGNEKDYSKKEREKELENLGKQLNLKNVALTYVPSFSDTESEADLNKIDPEVENTFVIYRYRTIIDKFVDLKPTKENFDLISHTLDKTKNEYFDLPAPKHD